MLETSNKNTVNDVVLVFLLLTLIFTPFSTVSFVDFKQVNVRLDLNMILSRTDL